MVHLFLTVMHCITIHPEIKVNSDVNLASGALHLVVELQFELSAMVIARQRKSLCNGAQCAMVHNVQWCTMQCSAVQCTYSVWNVQCCTYSDDTSTCAPVHALHLTGAQVSTPGALGVYMQ